MRNAFADEITKCAREHSRVTLLSGDIGNRLFDSFKEHCPERFFNCGVAEANMIGVAAGLAMMGMLPVAYTITPFITYRCFEQIRVDLCYHKLPALIVGVGSGLGYASLGATHHSCEDIACLRSLPHMTVLCPGDPVEVRALVRQAMNTKTPVYMRLGKKGEPTVHSGQPVIEIGKAFVIGPGNSVALLSTGTVLPMVQRVAQALRGVGVSIELVSFHTVKPLDEDYLRHAFERFSIIATVEEHSLIGGFGSAVAEWKTDHAPLSTTRLIRFGLRDEFFHEAGESEYARSQLGLSSEEIISRIKAAL